MGRPNVIVKYGLENIAIEMLQKGPGGIRRTDAEVAEILTERARQLAREETPDLAASMLEEIAVSTLSVFRFRQALKGPKPKRQIVWGEPDPPRREKPAIERYGLNAEAAKLLAPGPDGKGLSDREIAERLTATARNRARLEDPDLSLADLDKIRISGGQVGNFRKHSAVATRALAQHSRETARTLAVPAISAATLLIGLIGEVRQYWDDVKAQAQAASQTEDGKSSLSSINYQIVDRITGRLESMTATWFEMIKSGVDPALVQQFLALLQDFIVEKYGAPAYGEFLADLARHPRLRPLLVVMGIDGQRLDEQVGELQ